jgi:hypothetical protein
MSMVAESSMTALAIDIWAKPGDAGISKTLLRVVEFTATTMVVHDNPGDAGIQETLDSVSGGTHVSPRLLGIQELPLLDGGRGKGIGGALL